MYHYNNGKLSGFPQVLIATNTTTLFFTQALLHQIRIDVPIIYINKIIHSYLQKIEVIVEKTIEGYKHVYGERKVFLPDNWEALYEALENCISEFEPEPDILGEIYTMEYQLLCDEYRKTLSVEGNLLQRVYLEVACKEMPTVMQYHSYIITGEKDYEVLFEKCTVRGVNEIEFRFFPADIPPLCQNIVIEKLSYCQNGKKIEEYKNTEYKLSNKRPYIPFVIQSQGDEISRLTIFFHGLKRIQCSFGSEQC